MLYLIRNSGGPALWLEDGRSAPLRVRPGEHAALLHFPWSAREVRLVRQAARDFEVPPDVLVALALEYLDASEHLRTVGLDQAGDDAPAGCYGVEALPPTPELRSWVRTLQRGTRGEPDDDLPEVLIPRRLTPRIRRVRDGKLVARMVNLDFERVRGLELQAAARGMTLTEWMFLSGLCRTEEGPAS